MIIQSINIFRYSIPIINQSYARNQDNASGLLISVSIDGANTGWGEISCIDSRSSQSFNDFFWQIEEYKISIENQDLSFDELIGLVPIHISSPNVRYGLELAIYDLYSRSLSLPLSNFIKQDAPDSIYTNGFYITDIDLSSFDLIKVKLLSNNSISESNRIRSIVSDCPGSRLRLDGNQIFDLPRAIRFVKELEGLPIDYIEQLTPANNVDDISELRLHTDIKIAVDESVDSISSAQEIIDNSAADVFVIKPSQFGGISDLLEVVSLANQNNIEVVITHAFETAIGRMGNVHLALSLTSQPCGFGMGKYLKNDFGLDGISTNSRLQIKKTIGHGIVPSKKVLDTIEV